MATTKRPRLEQAQRDAVVFFYRHAGWGYLPGKETMRQGRIRGGRDLAEAEAWASATGVTFRWSDDWAIRSHVDEFDAYDAEPTTCEVCVAYDADGVVIGALGCVDDANAAYRRVVEAEIASEAMAEAAEPDDHSSQKEDRRNG